MSKGQRVGLIALVIAVAAVAFVVARPDDEHEQAGNPSADTTTTEPSSKADVPTATTDARPEERIELRDGKPAGGDVRTIEVKKGDFVRLTVESDAPDEIHLHGYDIEKEAAPGSPARFSFRADVEGIFEVEGHKGGETRIARLVVEPG